MGIFISHFFIQMLRTVVTSAQWAGLRETAAAGAARHYAESSALLRRAKRIGTVSIGALGCSGVAVVLPFVVSMPPHLTTSVTAVFTVGVGAYFVSSALSDAVANRERQRAHAAAALRFDTFVGTLLLNEHAGPDANADARRFEALHAQLRALIDATTEATRL
jgi:hypothetical protein